MTDQCCPACDRRIINRRLARCEFCDTQLPFDELVSADEMEASEDRLALREERSRLERAIERHRPRSRGGSLNTLGPHYTE